MAAQPVVVGAMTRGLAIFRPLALGYALVMAGLHRDEMTHPWAAAVTYAVLAAWTLAAALERRVTGRTVAVDLGLAVAGVLATNVAYPRDVVVGGIMTLPSIWSASGVVAAAIRGGERWGLAAAVAIAAADVVGVVEVNAGTVHNIVLLVLTGGLIGLSARLARESQRFLEASVRAEEAYAERERLSRAVHDGVLQALSYINRRGREIGGASVDLADLARDQERSLRALVTVGRGIRPSPVSEDLTAALRALQSAHVEVSMPAEPVTLAADRCAELVAAVRAALDNVATHAGPEARAWVLLDDLGDDIEVTIRDNGRGFAPGRLAAARAEGRLGVVTSIRGRLTDLGGAAEWVAAPVRGCTVTLSLPRATPAPAGRTET